MSRRSHFVEGTTQPNSALQPTPAKAPSVRTRLSATLGSSRSTRSTEITGALMRSKWGKYTIRVFMILVIMLSAMVAVEGLLIGSRVRAYSQTAQTQFPGKRVEALIAMVECQSCSTRDRNDAVWTLGQLDDPRAIPVLERLYTENKSNHLSIYRLQIALRHLRHEDNNRFESVLWRWILPAEK